MPPLVTEESDGYSEDDAQSQTDPVTSAPESRPGEETAYQPQSAGEAAQPSETQELGTHGEAQDDDLIAQLQRSAAEIDGDGDADAEGEVEDPSEAANQTAEDGQEQVDTTMNDVAEPVEDPTEEREAEEAPSDAEEANAGPAGAEETEDGQEAESASSEEEGGEESGGEDSDSDEEEAGSQESESSEEEEAVEDQNCIFCKQSEDNDPSDEFEPYLTCAACSKHAHQQCARENDALKDEQDPASWPCPDCANKSTDSESPKSLLARARNSNSAPRLVRDLLPVSRGVQKPNSHSIFAQPLISDGEDGGRSLRKRKSPTQEPVPLGKKRKGTPRAAAAASEMDEVEADRAVAHSTRRANQQQKSLPTARILQYRPKHKAEPHKFILAFRLEQEEIAKILTRPPRPGRRKDRKKQPKTLPTQVVEPSVPKFPALPSSHLIFPSIFSDRERELDSKPYGGILEEQDADTSRSLPQLKDREMFEIARREAEEERRRASTAAEAEINGDSIAVSKPNRTVSGPPSKIKCIQFGKFVIDTFYAAPYPEEYSHESRLFICEFCLKYLPSEFVAYRHKLKCPAKHPPGDEIYRDGSISIWEVDGRKKTEYCQCLCLMAKMFLGSKTLYYDVEPFLFYILTEYDELGYHFVGYFSKEKRPASQNNVSCILVMPIHQRKGYATFLIDFSYLLTRIEGKEGSPEKPLSDMGLTAYRAYWDLTISQHLLDLGMKSFSTRTLMERTGMTADDVIHSLERLYAFIKDPTTKTYGIRYDKKLYENIVHEYEAKQHRKLRPDNLIWTPYIMGRSDQANLDSAPLQTMAPREEEMEEESEPAKSAVAQEEADPDAVSPKTSTRASRKPSAGEEDEDLINDNGNIAPGPPSTAAMNATISTDLPELQVNGLVNGDNLEPETAVSGESSLTGYALAFRTQNIPATRFQITPPIHPSMLRARSTKKRAHGAAFGRGAMANQSPAPAVPVRSSPRNAGSVNGSANGTKGRRSRQATPEQARTPMRRSGRKTGLANMELASLDGTNDEEAQPESGGEEESKASGSEEEGSEEADEEAEEESSGEEEEDAEVEEAVSDDDEAESEAEPPDEEESSEEEDAEGEEVEAEAESLAEDDEEAEESED